MYDADETGLVTCGVLESGSCVEQRQDDGGGNDDEAESQPVPSFMEHLVRLRQ